MSGETPGTADDSFRADLVRPVHELLAGHAARQPGATAFTDAHRSVTYAELDRRTARLAGHLVGMGLDRGARAVIHLPHRVEAVESHLAVARAAAVGVPVDPDCTEAELAHVVDDCAARVLITDSARLPAVRRVLAGRTGVVLIVVGDPPGRNGPAPAAEDPPLFEALASAWSLRDPPRDDLGLDEPAWVLYTSGTTGRPKGVVSSQRTSLWATAACTVPLLGLSARDRVLSPMPLFHAAAHSMCLLAVLAVGASARLADAGDDVLATAAAERSTFLVGMPTMYRRMVEQARTADGDVPAPRVCMVVGASCPPALHSAFRAAFGVRLLDSYGTTETGGAITTDLPRGLRVPGSCGRPLPGLSLRLTDPRTGAEVGPGRLGEVEVRSPGLMLGYHGLPEATAAVLPDGWYRTGDLARQDADGRITLTGRLTDLIVRDDTHVDPRAVEEVLLQVPGVRDAAVGVVSRGAAGGVPVAYLVPGPDGVDLEAVLTACRIRLSAAEHPEEIHAVDEVPRNAAEEVSRARLAGLATRTLWRATREPADATRHAYAEGLGLSRALHPLLRAVVESPDSGEVVYTGRLAGEDDGTCPVPRAGERDVVPAAVLLELALYAAGESGCGRLEEFRVEQPLLAPENGGVQLRVAVGEPDALGGRTVAVHGRRDAGGARGRPWIRYARGRASPGTGRIPPWDLAAWPPEGAVRLTADGSPCGAGAETVRRVWRRGQDLFVEVSGPAEHPRRADGFGLHPALLDAVVAALPAARGDEAAVDHAATWRGVELHAVGAAVLRARVGPGTDGGYRVEAADGRGEPLLTAESVRSGRLAPQALRAASARQQDGLFEEVWRDTAPPGPPARGERWAVVGPDPLGAAPGLVDAGQAVDLHPGLEQLAKAVDGGTPAPDVVVVSCAPVTGATGRDEAGDVLDAVREAVDWTRHWSDPRFAGTRLLVLTRDAVPAWRDPAPGCLPGAAVWGLVSTVQERAAGRFVLADTDASPASWRVLRGAASSDEPRWALRHGQARAPRAVRCAAAVPKPATGGPARRAVLVAGRPCTDLARHLLGAEGSGGVTVTGPYAVDTAVPLRGDGAPVAVAAGDPADPADSLRAACDGGPTTVVLATPLAVDGTTADDAVRHAVATALALQRYATDPDGPRLVFALPAPRTAGLVAEAVAAWAEALARRWAGRGRAVVAVRGAASGTREACDLFHAAAALGRPAVIAARIQPDAEPRGAAGPGATDGVAAYRPVRGTVRRTARDGPVRSPALH